LDLDIYIYAGSIKKGFDFKPKQTHSLWAIAGEVRAAEAEAEARPHVQGPLPILVAKSIVAMRKPVWRAVLVREIYEMPLK